MTGKPLSKRQVYGKDSDEPVHYTVYGKDPQDIWDHHREEAASHLTALMVQRGLLGAEPAPDPATTAEIAILLAILQGPSFSCIVRNGALQRWKSIAVSSIF